MSKPTKQLFEPRTVLLVYKDENPDSWASAYGVTAIQIDQSILDQHGKVLSKSEPDVFRTFEINLIKKCYELFGL